MSSRALRRMLGSQLEPGAGAGPDRGDSEDNADRAEAAEEEPAAPAARATGNAFLALMAEEGDTEDENEDEDEQQRHRQEQQQQQQAPVSASKNKKKKKKKAKDKKNKDAAVPSRQQPDDSTLDEVDRAVQAVQSMLGEAADSAAGQSSTLASSAARDRSATSLLSIMPKHLNAEVEMQRKFRLARRGPTHAPIRARGRTVRSVMVTPKDTWPRMERSGLSMVVDREDAKTGDTWFRMVHNSMYQTVQMSFLRAVRTMDPAAISHVLRAHPYHIDSLLQLSEVCKLSGDMATAGDLNERALYAFEASFHPTFKMATGRCRLDYDIYENRAVFLAVYRQIEFAVHRGCWRAALELCKLLLSFDPDGDPLGAMLWIDYLCLRSSEFNYLRSLCEAWRHSKNLDWLPNFAYSEAMAYFMEAHESDDSEHAETLRALGALRLQTALIRFPTALIHTVDKCRAHLKAEILQHPHFQVPTRPNNSERNVELLAVLYAERAHTLYAPVHVLAWLEGHALTVIQQLAEDGPTKAQAEAALSRRQTRYPKTPRNIQRHAVMTETRTVLALLPPEATLDAVLAYDPLPPPDAPYVAEEISKIFPVKRLREEARATQGTGAPTSAFGVLEAFVRSLIPGFNIPEEDRQRAAAAVAAAGAAGDGREGEAQVDFARIRQELTAALGRLNLTELFNRQQGQDGEAVQDPAAYFEDADLADLDLLDLGGEDANQGQDNARGDDAR